jgi:hypothetical protein
MSTKHLVTACGIASRLRAGPLVPDHEEDHPVFITCTQSPFFLLLSGVDTCSFLPSSSAGKPQFRLRTACIPGRASTLQHATHQSYFDLHPDINTWTSARQDSCGPAP